MRPKFRITNRIAGDLTRIERARGFLDAASLSERWVKDYSAATPGVHRRTLQRDLRGLIELGLLQAEGATNQLAYRATALLRK